MHTPNSNKLLFLGTGTSTGIPLLGCTCEVCKSNDKKDKRLRSSVILQLNGKHILIDVGPDFRQQMFRAAQTQIDACLLTHAHKDHVGGIDEVRALNVLTQKPFDIYLDKIAAQTVVKQYDYIFEGKDYPGIPKINLHEIHENAFQLHGINIQPIRVMHYNLPVLGYRFGDLTYITDANFINEEEKEKIKGSKILILNALRKETHISHYNLEQALQLIEEVKPEKTYLTHISHHMGLHAMVEKELPTNVHLAYDELELEF